MHRNSLRLLHLLLGCLSCGCGLLVGSDDHHLKSEEATTDAGYDGADGSHEAPAGDVAPGTDTGTEVPDARTETALITAPLVIGHQRFAPIAIGVDSSAVYWLEAPHDGASGAILKLEKGKNAGPVVLASGFSEPRSLALDEKDVYATDAAPGGIAGTGGLYRVAKIGGNAIRIDTDTAAGFGELVLDADYAYSEAPIGSGVSRRVRRSNKQGSPMDSCDVLKESNFTSVWLGPFAVDADSIYYVHSALHDTKKKPKTCLAVGGFGLAAEPAQGVAVDDTYLFWVMPDGTVRRHDKNVSNLDAAAITLWDGRGALASQHRLVLSPNDVFVTSLENGTVSVVPKLGGALRQLASGQSEPSSIAVDTDGVVYWTNRQSGEIMSLDPR